MVSPTTAVPCVLVSVVPLIAVPAAFVFALMVPPVTVNPAVTFATTKVKVRPSAAVGRVHDGEPDVERLMRTLPESASVRTTVAPTRADCEVARLVGPVGATVKVVAPVTPRVPPTRAFAVVVTSSSV